MVSLGELTLCNGDLTIPEREYSSVVVFGQAVPVRGNITNYTDIEYSGRVCTAITWVFAWNGQSMNPDSIATHLSETKSKFSLRRGFYAVYHNPAPTITFSVCETLEFCSPLTNVVRQWVFTPNAEGNYTCPTFTHAFTREEMVAELRSAAKHMRR